MNDYISSDHTSVTYARVDGTVRLSTQSRVASFWPKQILRVHSALSLFCLRITIFSECVGGDCFTMIIAWSWAADFRAFQECHRVNFQDQVQNTLHASLIG